jgi:hypothetical protein
MLPGTLKIKKEHLRRGHHLPLLKSAFTHTHVLLTPASPPHPPNPSLMLDLHIIHFGEAASLCPSGSFAIKFHLPSESLHPQFDWDVTIPSIEIHSLCKFKKRAHFGCFINA